MGTMDQRFTTPCGVQHSPAEMGPKVVRQTFQHKDAAGDAIRINVKVYVPQGLCCRCQCRDGGHGLLHRATGLHHDRQNHTAAAADRICEQGIVHGVDGVFLGEQDVHTDGLGFL